MITEERIAHLMGRISIDDNGCWIWKGRHGSSGRPVFSKEWMEDGKRRTRTYQVHQVLYEYKNGEVRVRYIDNMCDNYSCVNPDHHQPRTFETRFWKKVDKPDGEDGCWLWKGDLMYNQYGRVTVDGKAYLVHRLAYQLYYNEEIPNDRMILHSCNNRSCMNPAHLRLGTHAENMQDMVDANRQAKGEDNGNSKLTLDEIVEIKELLASGKYFHREIAAMYGISRPAVTDINKGKTWKRI